MTVCHATRENRSFKSRTGILCCNGYGMDGSGKMAEDRLNIGLNQKREVFEKRMEVINARKEALKETVQPRITWNDKQTNRITP